MFYLIGLGLADEKDITVKGLEIVKRAERVYLEAYTSILMVDQERLEAFYGRPLIVADRDMVETASDEILADAHVKDIALLVVGDPFGATTHADILLRARSASPPVPTAVIHNASIMNAIGACGLQLYNFGQAVSIPFWTETWKPDSWLERIRENARIGLHTLVLLDIKVKEQSEENLARGRKIYEKPRYMNPSVAVRQILDALETNPEPSTPLDDDASSTQPSSLSATSLDPSKTLALSLSRVGTTSQSIVAGTLAELAAQSDEVFGPPLHSLVIVGSRVHPLEIIYAGEWAIGGQAAKKAEDGWWTVARDVYGVKVQEWENL